MTYREMVLHQRGVFSRASCTGSCSSFHPYVQPIPEDNMAHVKQEKSDTVFNGLSLSDVADNGKYRDMDALHKADAVVADLGRGERLGAELKEVGADVFASRRLQK